jgi:trehalose synthase
MVNLVHPVQVTRRPVAQLAQVIGGERHQRLIRAAGQFRQRLAGRVIWNVSSTAVGGGVAEMLHVLTGYVDDLDIPIRWSVITGDAGFFTITKRLHNQIHGDQAGGPLGQAEAGHYARMLAANAVELLEQIRPGDLVLLHDPQTAGLTGALAGAGARVTWRCHIGVDWENDATRAAWSFLRPHLAAAEGYVFSRRQYVPSWVPGEKVAVIPPSIDPFSPKNQHLDEGTVRAILARIGVLDGTAPDGPTSFTRTDGSTGDVTRSAAITGEGRPGPGDQLVVQVSRWDRLKDMLGVMQGFADHVAPGGRGYLVLAGPSVAEVSDDPEGAAVFGECLLHWRGLPAAVRARVLLVTLPLDDIDENAAMVNALQRHATVITQKSLAEGFGLTVAEGMWKARPVVGSAVGGIIDQIADGTGILLSDPRDLRAFGSALRRLLDDPGQAGRIGRAAHSYIAEQYVGDLHLLRYAQLLGQMTAADERLQAHLLYHGGAVYDHLATLIRRGRPQLYDPLVIAFLRDRHHHLDGIADLYRGHKTEVLAEVNGIRPGKLGAEHRGDQPGHEHAVRDPLSEHRLGGMLGIGVNRVPIPGEAGVIHDMHFSDRPGERGFVTDLDVLVG